MNWQTIHYLFIVRIDFKLDKRQLNQLKLSMYNKVRNGEEMKKTSILNKYFLGLGTACAATPICLAATSCNSSNPAANMYLQIDNEQQIYHNNASSEIVAHVSEINGVQGITYKWECTTSSEFNSSISIDSEGTITAFNNPSVNGYLTYKIWGEKDGYTSNNEVYLNIAWQPIVNGVVYEYYDDCYNARALDSSTISGNVTINSSINGINVSSIMNNGFNFANIDSLTITNLHGGTIGAGAFFSCTNLTSVSLNNVSNINSTAFASCSNLTSVNFGINLENIYDSAFEDCMNYTSINLSNCSNLNWIGSKAFYGCTPENIVIPANVSYIGESAFGNNSMLQSVTLLRQDVSWIDPTDPCWFSANNSLTTIYVPSGEKANYEQKLSTTTWWSDLSGQVTIQEITE